MKQTQEELIWYRAFSTWRDVHTRVLHAHPTASYDRRTAQAPLLQAAVELLPYHLHSSTAFESQYQFHMRVYKKSREAVL